MFFSFLRKSQWKTGVPLTVQVVLCFLICCGAYGVCGGLWCLCGDYVSVTDEYFIKMMIISRQFFHIGLSWNHCKIIHYQLLVSFLPCQIQGLTPLVGVTGHIHSNSTEKKFHSQQTLIRPLLLLFVSA